MTPWQPSENRILSSALASGELIEARSDSTQGQLILKLKEPEYRSSPSSYTNDMLWLGGLWKGTKQMPTSMVNWVTPNITISSRYFHAFPATHKSSRFFQYNAIQFHFQRMSPLLGTLKCFTWRAHLQV